jgi:hypothetical protein
MGHPATDVRSRLAADGLVAAIFEGGVYVPHAGGAGGGQHPINPADTPAAYETEAGSGVRLLLPCLLVVVESEAPVGAGGCHRQIILRLEGYQRDGYSSIRDGFARARQTLHKTQGTFTGVDGSVGYYTEFLDAPFQNLTDASLVTGANKRPACYEAARFIVVTEYE